MWWSTKISVSSVPSAIPQPLGQTARTLFPAALRALGADLTFYVAASSPPLVTVFIADWHIDIPTMGVYTPNMKENNPPNDNMKAANYAAICACFNVRKASRAITSLYDDYLRPTGFRATQATLLMALQQAGTISIGRLSDILLMDRTTLARDLQPLIRQALITMAEGSDRRMRMVSLTPAGHEALARVLPLWESAQNRVIAELGDNRYQSLLGQLNLLVNGIRPK